MLPQQIIIINLSEVANDYKPWSSALTPILTPVFYMLAPKKKITESGSILKAERKNAVVEMTAFFAFARHLLCSQGYYIKSTLFILMITESTLTAARPQSLI